MRDPCAQVRVQRVKIISVVRLRFKFHVDREICPEFVGIRFPQFLRISNFPSVDQILIRRFVFIGTENKNTDLSAVLAAPDRTQTEREYQRQRHSDQRHSLQNPFHALTSLFLFFYYFASNCLHIILPLPLFCSAAPNSSFFLLPSTLFLLPDFLLFFSSSPHAALRSSLPRAHRLFSFGSAVPALSFSPDVCPLLPFSEAPRTL